MSQNLDQNLTELKSEFSGLIAQSQNVIETEIPRVDQLLENLTNATEGLDGLRDNFTLFLDKAQHGEGSIAYLLNRRDPLDQAQKALKTAEETMIAIRGLSRTLDQGSKQFKLPDLAWDYEPRTLR